MMNLSSGLLAARITLSAQIMVAVGAMPLDAAIAQEVIEQPVVKMCMIRTSEGNTGAIVLPSSDVEAMLAKGFVASPCDQAFSGEADERDWRDRICRFAATAPEGMQQNMEGVMGERPATLCGMAEAVLGQWDQTQIYQ